MDHLSLSKISRKSFFTLLCSAPFLKKKITLMHSVLKKGNFGHKSGEL
jgi:hypothetical protein